MTQIWNFQGSEHKSFTQFGKSVWEIFEQKEKT